MNKKQLVIAWIMGIVMVIIYIQESSGYKYGIDNYFFDCLPVFIIGGLFLYTLKSKAKSEVENNAIKQSNNKVFDTLAGKDIKNIMSKTNKEAKNNPLSNGKTDKISLEISDPKKIAAVKRIQEDAKKAGKELGAYLRNDLKLDRPSATVIVRAAALIKLDAEKISADSSCGENKGNEGA